MATTATAGARVTLQVRIEPELYYAVKRAAEELNMTLIEYVSGVLKAATEEK